MGRLTWIACGTLIGLFVAYQALYFAWCRGVFQHVPATRDPRLIGRWIGRSEFGRPAPVEFRADGTAQTPFMPNAKALWGSSKGVLYVKQRSAGEGWNLASAPYRVEKGGRSVLSQSGRWWFMIPEKMSRRP